MTQADIVSLHIRGDREDVARVACHCFAKLLDFEHVVEVFLWVLGLQHEQQVFQVGERVGLEVAEEHSVVLVLKSEAERKRVQSQLHALLALVLVAHDQVLVPVVVRSTLAVHRLVAVLVVAHVVATPLPLVRLVGLVLLDRVDEGLHPGGVRAVVFLQVVDVKAHSVAFADVAH